MTRDEEREGSRDAGAIAIGVAATVVGPELLGARALPWVARLFGATRVVGTAAKAAPRVTSEIGPALGWTKNGANDLASRLSTEVAAKDALSVSSVEKLAQDGFTKGQFERLVQKLESSATNSLKEHNQLLQSRIDHLKEVIKLWSN